MNRDLRARAEAAEARVAALEGALRDIAWQNAPGSEWCIDRAREALASLPAAGGDHGG